MTNRARALTWLLALVTASALVAADELPDGWTASPLESFDRTPFAVSTPPQPVVARDFTRFALTGCADARVSGSSARWQFQPAAGVTQAALGLPSDQPLDGLAVWVKNPLEHAAGLSLRATDAAGRTWRTEPRWLLTQKAWFRYVLDLQALFSAEQSPQLPFRSIELVLTDLKPGTAYTFYLDEVCTLQAPPPQLRVTEFTAPAQVDAGRTASLRMGFQRPAAGTRPVALTVTLASGSLPVMLKTVSLGPGQSSLDLPLVIPRHISGGAYQLKLGAQGAELGGMLARDLTVAAEAAPTRLEVLPPSQGGCFAVDGQGLPLIGGWWRAGTLPTQAPWLILPLTSDFDFTGQSSPVWLAADKYDYAAAHARLAAALGANPQAYLIPAVAISSPPWWDQQHPKDLMVFGDGKAELPGAVPGAKRTFASWASPAWRRDAAAALTRLIQHLEGSPWGPAIIGYQLCSGEGGRWVYPGVSDGVFSDYSGPQQDAFRAWLKSKYHDVSMLRIAWGQPKEPVTTAEALKEFRPILGWNDARIPTQARRTRAPSGVLHDPNAAQDVVDYQIFCSDTVADTIRLLAKSAREASANKKLIGAAYGHLFDLAATRYGLQNGGHLSLSPICAADELSFIVSPGTFGDSTSPPVPTTVASSLAAHGKLWVAQGDAAHATATVANAAAVGGVAAVEERPRAAWSQRLASLAPTMPRATASEIAVIVDDISAAYTACGSDLVKPLLADQRLGLSLLGAPCDVWTLDDVLSGVAVGYRLYVFLDAFYLDANARKQLLGALSQQPCTALWIYAPGALDSVMSSRNIRELTGLTLVRPLRTVVQPGKAKQVEGEPIRTDAGPLQVKIQGSETFTYGASVSVTPRFACVDDRADIRGTLVGTEYGGFAVSERDGLKSVWSAAPQLPASLLRSIAQDADVHVFGDSGTGVYANQNLIAVRASTDGEQRLHLPRLAEVVDLDTGRPVAKAANEFVARLKAGEIKLYYWGVSPLIEK